MHPARADLHALFAFENFGTLDLDDGVNVRARSGVHDCFSFNASCTPAMAMLPSPTAAAQRLTEPERTSPTAKTPGKLVSSATGARVDCFQSGVSETSAPVSMKPFLSRKISGGNHSVHGVAPIIEKTAGFRPCGARLSSCFPIQPRRELSYPSPAELWRA